MMKITRSVYRQITSTLLIDVLQQMSRQLLHRPRVVSERIRSWVLSPGDGFRYRWPTPRSFHSLFSM